MAFRGLVGRVFGHVGGARECVGACGRERGGSKTRWWRA